MFGNYGRREKKRCSFSNALLFLETPTVVLLPSLCKIWDDNKDGQSKWWSPGSRLAPKAVICPGLAWGILRNWHRSHLLIYNIIQASSARGALTWDAPVWDAYSWAAEWSYSNYTRKCSWPWTSMKYAAMLCGMDLYVLHIPQLQVLSFELCEVRVVWAWLTHNQFKMYFSLWHTTLSTSMQQENVSVEATFWLAFQSS